jgi:RNA polymerase sigma-70 factor, ECF subfamily
MTSGSHKRVCPAPDFAGLRRRAFEAARQVWPGLTLAFQRFCDHLDGLGHTQDLPVETSALYLCAACADRQPAAWKALEEAYFPALAHSVRRFVSDADLVDDVLQDVRRRLIVDSPPKIASYRGHGALAGWLRIVAVHVALDQRRARGAIQRRKLELEAWSAIVRDQRQDALLEPELFEQRCVQILERGLSGAVLKLAAAERNLLHLYLVHGLSIDVLGRMYDVHRATVARRIRRYLDRIGSELLSQLTAEIGQFSREDLAGVVRFWYRYSSFSMARLFSARVELGEQDPSPNPVSLGN